MFSFCFVLAASVESVPGVILKIFCVFSLFLFYSIVAHRRDDALSCECFIQHKTTATPRVYATVYGACFPKARSGHLRLSSSVFIFTFGGFNVMRGCGLKC